MKHVLSVLTLLFPLCVLSQEDHVFHFETIAGNEIAWSCEGEGQPTIVLVAGMGLSAHASFSRIYHNYRGPGRICMYDRAGMGESTFRNQKTRTLKQLTNELHELSVRQKWGKLLLTAHSFGGFIARAYASDYPNEVVGILLLDAPHEDWLPRLQAEMSATDWSIMERILEWNVSNFREDYIEAQEAMRTATIADGLPITVLSRGIPHVQIRLERMSYEGIDLFDGEHNVLQTQLARLSSNSKHRIARYSSHLINDFDPWLVIEEIERLVERRPD